MQPHGHARQSVFLRSLSLEYSYTELQKATEGWHQSRRLGQGAFGAVFKGELEDATFVAIKLIDLAALSHAGQDPSTSGFEEEVRVLSKFRHPNLVTLLGWGKNQLQRFLIYELMPGGDVNHRLTKSKSGELSFAWHERLEVLLDSASGLSHMHNSKPKVFHRDIKSANILLDKNGTAKMADFGLSFEHMNGSAVVQNASGTPGYICPLYARSCVASTSSDAYSFGMVILELLLGLTPAVADQRQPDGIGYPVGCIIAPSNPRIGGFEPGALERAMANLDRTGQWPVQVASEMSTLGLRSVNTMDANQRPAAVDIVRAIRELLKRFPKESVVNVPNSGSSAGNPATPRSYPNQPTNGTANYSPRPNGAGSMSPRPTQAQEATQQRQHLSLELIFASGINMDFLPDSLRRMFCAATSSSPQSGSSSFLFQVGRKHQPNLFEAWLPDSSLRDCVSRTTFEISWAPGSKQGLFTSRGSNSLAVDGKHVTRGQTVPLEAGADVGFTYNSNTMEVFLVLRFQPGAPAQPSLQAGAQAPTDPGQPFSPRPLPGSVQPRKWRFMCVGVQGLAQDVLQTLPLEGRSFELQDGNNPVGRQHQANAFTTLMRGAPADFTKVSRTHVSINVNSTNGLSVTNMSNWPVMVNERALNIQETGRLVESDVLSFAKVEHSGQLVKFISFQLIRA